MSNNSPENETVVETTTSTFTRTVSRGKELANLQLALSNAKQIAQQLGLELIVSLVDDLAAAQSNDQTEADAANARVTATLGSLGQQISDLQAELAAAQGLAVTQSMVDKANGIANTLGTIDPAAVVTPPPPPPPPVFVQGTNADGTPMVDPVTGAPVDQNGNPDPNATTAPAAGDGTVGP